jgi:uncharacterized protein
MDGTPLIPIPRDQIADFCRRHRIKRLALFGSVLRDDFGPESDIDVLVEFEPGTRVGLFTFQKLEDELTSLIGRRVDLNTAGFLNRQFRDQVLQEARPIHVAA